MQGVVLDSLYKLWLLTTTLLKNESLVNACLVTDRQMQNDAWSPERIGTGGLKNHRFTKFICMRIALWNYIAVNWQHLTSWELERRAMQNRLLYCQSMAYALCKYPACMVGTLTTSLGHMTVWITFFGQTSLFNLIWPTTWIMKTSLLCPWDTYNTPWCDVIWRHGVTSQCGVRWPMSRVPPPRLTHAPPIWGGIETGWLLIWRDRGRCHDWSTGTPHMEGISWRNAGHPLSAERGHCPLYRGC